MATDNNPTWRLFSLLAYTMALVALVTVVVSSDLFERRDCLGCSALEANLGDIEQDVAELTWQSQLDRREFAERHMDLIERIVARAGSDRLSLETRLASVERDIARLSEANAANTTSSAGSTETGNPALSSTSSTASPVPDTALAPDNAPFWVQLYPHRVLGDTGWEGGAPGRLIARTIVPLDQPCPEISVAGEPQRLLPHDPVYPGAFPVRVCESPRAYPGEADARTRRGPLPKLPAEPKRILLLGDTGCRVTFYKFQHCEEAEDGKKRWPFAQVARAAARHDVDLILHVGDYHYRERPCPVGHEATCGTGQGGYAWPAWRADFFAPAQALLSEAPWVFLRGNHENCGRAGVGWSHFFWPELRERRQAGTCLDHHAPYLVKLAPDLSLLVLDVANAEDEVVFGGTNRYRADVYAGWMEQLKNSDVEGALWVAMHQPPWQWPWKPNVKADDTKKATVEPDNTSGQTSGEDSSQSNTPPPETVIRDRSVVAIRTALMAPDGSGPDVSLVLAGDTHMFQALRPAVDSEDDTVADGAAPGLPWVLVSGMSGTDLDKEDSFKPGLDKTGGPLLLRDDRSDREIKCGDARPSNPPRLNYDGKGEEDEKKVECDGVETAGPPRQPDARLTAYAWYGYGYTILEKDGEAWRADVYDETGVKRYGCALTPGGECDSFEPTATADAAADDE